MLEAFKQFSEASSTLVGQAQGSMGGVTRRVEAIPAKSETGVP